MSASSVTTYPDAPDAITPSGTTRLANVQAPAAEVSVMRLPGRGSAAKPTEEHHRDNRNHSKHPD